MFPVVWPFASLGFSGSSKTMKVTISFFCCRDFPILLIALKRRILAAAAAAAAAGVSVAFGSPLGGVLFGLEGEQIHLL